MRQVATVVLVLTACIGMYWFFFMRAGEQIANYPPKNHTVVAFGDSLVAGYGATPGNDFVSVLGKRLGKVIVNLGVGGNTSADGLARIETVIEQKPGIVILLLGGNDYLKRIDEGTTRSNLSAIVELLKENGAVVIIAGVRRGIIRDGSDELYEAIAEAYGAIYVPNVLDGIFLKPDLMYDAIHPNDRGYAIIADRLYTVFTDFSL